MNLRIWLSCLAIIVVGRLVFWLEPYGISVDESNYMAIAEAWDHYGRLYVDAVDRKPPLFYFVYWLIGKAFGFWNIHALHLSFIALSLFLAWMAEKVAQKLSHPPRPGFAALLYAITSSTFSREILGCNAELVFMIFLSTSFFFLMTALQDSRFKAKTLPFALKIASAAVLMTLATLCKQIAVVPFLFASVVLAWALISQRSWKFLMGGFLACALGMSVVFGCTALILHNQGISSDFLYWVLQENLSYVNESTSVSEKLSRPLFSPFFASWLTWPLHWIAVVMLLHRKLRGKSSLGTGLSMIVAACLGSVAIIYIGGRLYSHYFVPLSWFLSIAAAGTLSRDLWIKKSRLVMGVLAVFFSAFFCIITFRDEIMPLVQPGKKSHSFDRATQEKLKAVSAYVHANSESQDRIAVWGMAGQIYVLSQRGSGTRFIYSDYVSGRLAGFQSSSKKPSPLAMKLYLSDLTTKKPLYFVDTSSASINDYQYFPLTDYPDLYHLIHRDYQKVSDIAGFSVWRLKT